MEEKKLLRVASYGLKEKEIIEYWKNGRMVRKVTSCRLRVTGYRLKQIEIRKEWVYKKTHRFYERAGFFKSLFVIRS